ncbi:MAG: hypothetical protein KJO15_17270 [Alphaproteobacteria bacterium]|nr:hypothetical protein [Alphaproteobacteria bacterium]
MKRRMNGLDHKRTQRISHFVVFQTLMRSGEIGMSARIFPDRALRSECPGRIQGGLLIGNDRSGGIFSDAETSGGKLAASDSHAKRNLSAQANDC